MIYVGLLLRFVICTAMAYAVATVGMYYTMEFGSFSSPWLHVICIGCGVGGLWYGPALYDALKEYAEPLYRILNRMTNWMS